jgi:T5SS/PEP-CTERM-associated repeat protein
MRALDVGSGLAGMELRRDTRALFCCATLLLWAGPAGAAITTSGNVNPHPATTTTSDTLYIGETAFGTMAIDGGSDVVSGTSYLGDEDAATGIVTVSGSGSTWTTRNLLIGNRGGGELTIADGAAINTTGPVDIANNGEFSDGVVTVTGANSQWTISSVLNIGDEGNAAMTIENGGQVSSGFGRIGGFDGVGTVTISGMGSRWASTSTLTVADGNQGTLTISDGGLMSNSSGTIASSSDSVGTVTIRGANSTWTSTGDLAVASSGTGMLTINDGLAEVVQDTFVGRSGPGNGTIHFSNGTLMTGGLLVRFSDLKGTGTINTHGLVTDNIDLLFDQNNGLERQFTLDSEPDQNILVNLQTSDAGSLGAGFRGQASLTIAGGVTVASRNGYFGYHSGATGEGTVEGAGSNWIIRDDLNVGYNGTGTLSVGDGAAVNVGRSTYVGRFGGNSTIHLDNAALTTKSLWVAPSRLQGSGTINTNGLVSDIQLVFDEDHPAQQQIVFNSEPGQNVTINLNADGSGAIGAGFQGVGSLTIADGLTVRSNAGYLGRLNGSYGTATVTGEDSAWIIGGEFNIGLSGTGELTISGGASVSSVTGNIANGRVTVSGEGSLWTNSSWLAIGQSSDLSELRITGGGRVVSASQPSGFPLFSGIGEGFRSNGRVTVTGPGSSWTHGATLTVGRDGNGVLMISGGGRVTTMGAALGNGIGFLVTEPSSATITDPGSEWINSGAITVGNGQAAAMTISDGARVTSTDGFIAAGFTSFGAGPATVTLSGADSIWDISGRLGVGGGSFSPGGPALMTIGSGAAVDVIGETRIYRQGILKLDGGALATSEMRFDFTGGQFQWTSGTLHVGRYNGNLTNAAGVLAPGESAGSTTITGSYIQQAAATLEIEIGGINPTSQHDLVTVQNGAALDGQLQLALINSFVPGAQNIFTVLSAVGNINGAFSNVASGQRLATSDGAGSFLVHYGAGSAFNARQIVLTNFQSSTLAGDFNRDGSVDAADYVVWRRNPSGNAFVDTTNYQTWRANFGRTAEQLVESTHVPEPSAFALIGTMLIAAPFFTRPRPS